MCPTDQIAKDRGLSTSATWNVTSSPCAALMACPLVCLSADQANTSVPTLVAPWGVLGQGKFKHPKELEERAKSLRGGMPPTENQLKLAKALEEVAREIGPDVGLTGGESMCGVSKEILH
jgi:hypothetical protein